MTSGDYTVVWAPYYTAHKILRGLLDAYLATDDARALDLAVGHVRLDVLPAVQAARTPPCSGCGASSPAASSAASSRRSAICTRSPARPSTSRWPGCSTSTSSSTPAPRTPTSSTACTPTSTSRSSPAGPAVRRDGRGALPRPRRRTSGAWSCRPGCTASAAPAPGVLEGARASSRAPSATTNAETCCAYNMLKLSRMLFFHEQDPKYMDYYERALLQPGPRLQAGQGRRGEAARHVLHRPDARPCARLHAQAGHHLLRGHRHGERHEVPGLGVLQDGRRQRAVRQPVQPVHAAPGPRRASRSPRPPTIPWSRAPRSPSGAAPPPSTCGCGCRPGRRPASG